MEPKDKNQTDKTAKSVEVDKSTVGNLKPNVDRVNRHGDVNSSPSSYMQQRGQTLDPKSFSRAVEQMEKSPTMNNSQSRQVTTNKPTQSVEKTVNRPEVNTKMRDNQQYLKSLKERAQKEQARQPAPSKDNSPSKDR